MLKYLCSKGYDAHRTSISHPKVGTHFMKNPVHHRRKMEEVLYKIGAAVEIDVPDLKCAREHHTPLSTRYVPYFKLSKIQFWSIN
jgi:hypothetical protein